MQRVPLIDVLFLFSTAMWGGWSDMCYGSHSVDGQQMWEMYIPLCNDCIHPSALEG